MSIIRSSAKPTTTATTTTECAVQSHPTRKKEEKKYCSAHLGLDEDLEAIDDEVVIAFAHPDDGISGVHHVVVRSIHDQTASEKIVRDHWREKKNKKKTTNHVKKNKKKTCTCRSIVWYNV